MKLVKLFVYGTLRKGSKGHRYLLSANLLAENEKIYGLRMYDNGFYPFVIKVDNLDEFVVGEIYQIAENILPKLDHYEGTPSLYKRVYHEKKDLYLYLSQATALDHLPIVPQGDWLTYKATK